MKFQLQLASNGLSGWVTNPVTGESYPCTWALNCRYDLTPENPWDLFPKLVRTGTTIDIEIEIDPRFFGSRQRGPQAEASSLPMPALTEEGTR